MNIKIEKMSLELDYSVNIIDVTEDYVMLSNGDTITYDHVQDCCEHNYADFNSLLDTTLITDKFHTLNFEIVEGYGFRLNGNMINCYSIQNGYYSTELDIYYNTRDKKINILSLDSIQDGD